MTNSDCILFIYATPRFRVAVYADMVKLADTLDLGSSIERCAGSNPVIRTKGLEFRLRAQ